MLPAGDGGGEGVDLGLELLEAIGKGDQLAAPDLLRGKRGRGLRADVDAIDEDLQPAHAHALGFQAEARRLGEGGGREGAHHFGEHLGEAGLVEGRQEHLVEELRLGLQQVGGLRRRSVAQDGDAAVGVELQAPGGDALGQRRSVHLTA